MEGMDARKQTMNERSTKAFSDLAEHAKRVRCVRLEIEIGPTTTYEKFATNAINKNTHDIKKVTPTYKQDTNINQLFKLPHKVKHNANHATHKQHTVLDAIWTYKLCLDV